MNVSKQWIALLLTLTLLFQIVPLSVFSMDGAPVAGETEITEPAAAETEASLEIGAPNDPVPAPVLESEEHPSYVLYEDPAHRSASEKHFRMNGGAFTAVEYGEVIHYEDAKGEWQDINNVLKLQEGSEKEPAVYEAVNGDEVRQFAATVDETGFLYAVGSGENRIAFYAATPEQGERGASEAIVENPEPFKGTEEEFQALPLEEQVQPWALMSSLSYFDLWEKTDLAYQVHGFDVKESIVLNGPEAANAYAFRMELDGLSAVLTEEGGISLTDPKGEEVFYIPAPYMEDAKGEISEAVFYELKVENKTAALTVTADEEWLRAPDRAYPVVIDPTITRTGVSTSNLLLTGFISDTGYTTYRKTQVRCGYNSSTGNIVGLIYADNLQDIPEGYVVTSAILKLYKTDYTYTGTANSTKYVHLYSSTLSSVPGDMNTYLYSTVTWSDYGVSGDGSSHNITRNSLALDYKKAPVSGYSDWDITELYQSWLEDTTGASHLLVLDDGHNGTASQVTYAGYAASSYRPKLVITYRNPVGLENIYTYQTQNAGRAGTGSINNYTLGLNLSVPLFSFPSDGAAFSFGLYYNSQHAAYLYTGNQSYNIGTRYGGIYALNYTTGETGWGWKTSVQQSIRELTTTSPSGATFSYKYLVWCDTDGTEHYFRQGSSGSSYYYDEDGLGLTIYKASTYYKVTDLEKNEWYFYHGYLTYAKDNRGNCLYYGYDGNAYASGSTSYYPQNNTEGHRVTGVWRKNKGGSLEHLLTLNYTGNVLTSVTDVPGSRTINLTHNTAGELTGITFYDNQTAAYAYTNYGAFHRLSEVVDNELGYKVEYGYMYAGRVMTVKEKTKTSTNTWELGQAVNFWKVYPAYTRCRYYQRGTDSSEADSLVECYRFDDQGRTVNAISFDETEQKVLGVSMGEYTETDGTSKKNNRITKAAAAGFQGVNLLANPGFEVTDDNDAVTDWLVSGTGNALIKDAANSGLTATPRSGSRYLKMFYNSSSGNEKVYQLIQLQKDQTYVFSAYVNTLDATSISTSSGVSIAFYTSNLQQVKAESRKIKYDTNAAIANGWERLEAVFTPTVTTTYAICIIQTGPCPLICVDDVQLEKAPDLNDYNLYSGSTVNLLQSPSFEQSNYGTYWYIPNYSVAGRSSSVKLHGDYSIYINGSPNTRNDRFVSQQFYANCSSNTTFILSGWGKANSAPNANNENTSLPEPFFGLIAEIIYTDTTTPEQHRFAFPSNTNEWQFVSGMLVPKRADKTIQKIIIYCAYYDEINTAWFDAISLTKEPVQTYSYNDDGKQTLASNSQGNTSTTYDNYGRLSAYENMADVTTTITYANTTTRDPHTVAVDGVTTTYEYDTKNGAANKTTTKNGTSVYLESSAGYDANGNHKTSVTDTNGASASYTYNAKNQVTQTINAGGTTVGMGYDAAGRSANSYIAGEVSTTNTYQSGQLESVARMAYRGTDRIWQKYSFVNNLWGQSTQIKVSMRDGDNGAYSTELTLGAYEYEPNGGCLTRMTYGNGQYVRYYYDLFDRLVRTEYYNYGSTTPQVTYYYLYNPQGVLAKQYAIQNGTKVQEFSFEYDSLGRLIRSWENGANGVTVQRTEHLYDTANRLTQQRWFIGDDKFGEAFTYNQADGSLATDSLSALNQTLGSVSYNYDALKRGASTVYTTNSSHMFKRWLTYADDASTNKGSTRISQEIYRDGTQQNSGTLLYGRKYTYYDDGNIQEIKDSQTSKKLLSYEYDDLGQLTLETTYNTDETVKDIFYYRYDNAGNLLETRLNGLTIGTYTYGNGQWADLLTSYNGHTISYPTTTATVNGQTVTLQSGNPENWYNGSTYTGLTWEKGRQLVHAAKGSTQIDYSYDMEGVRSSKTVGGVTHNYVTQNGKVVRERWNGSYTIWIIYDAGGKPFSMLYSYDGGVNWSTYYYVLNLQGDVVKLVDANGNAVASYTYDAWGKPLTATGSMASINPLRYRGYYYDTETGWYYLQSRYYDPIVKRFLNADAYGSTGQGFLGYNMFAYCANNPVMNIDPTGQSWWGWGIAALLVVGLVAASILTCGGAALAAGTAMAIAAGTCTAVSATATVLTGAAMGATVAFTTTAICAANEAHNLDEFASYGEAAAVNTIVGSAGGAGLGYINSQTVCFVEGTLVYTTSGTVPIEQIKAGDSVWAWDEETGTLALKPVVETYINETDELTHIYVNGEEIVCTPTHPFYAPKKGWTDACRLRAGDILVLVNGEYLVVEKVQHELLESPIKVYNFQVQDYHTYFVAAGVLVHNSCNHGYEWARERQSYWKQAASTAVEGKDYGSYVATADNIARMEQGKAPIGWDGYSVQLHHWQGIAVDFFDYSALSRTLHQLIHSLK